MDEQTPAVAAVEPATQPSPGFPRSVVEWWTRRDAMARAKRQTRVLGATERSHLARAQAATKLGDYVLTREGLGYDLENRLTKATAPWLAFVLYREAVTWALAASAEGGQDDATSAFDKAPKSLLVESAGSEEALASLRASFAYEGASRFDALAADARTTELELTRRFAHRLVDTLDQQNDPVTRVKRQRRLRVLIALGALLVVLGIGGLWVRSVVWPDFAASAKWTASSAYGGAPIRGTGFRLVNKVGPVFFHTNEEESPWIKFDLGTPKQISSIGIRNRPECCQERAVPLVVETSVDDKTWSTVGQRADKFMEWDITFPKREARFVRMRVPRKTVFHLNHVEIR